MNKDILKRWVTRFGALIAILIINQNLFAQITSSDFTSSTLSSGASPNTVAVADFDGDGKMDMVAPQFATTNSGVYVFRNISSGGGISFDTPVLLSVTHGATDIAVADINQDGLKDIVMALWPANTVGVLLNNSTVGSISFLAVQEFTAGANATAIKVADVDQDGLMDVVVGANSDDFVSIYRNITTASSSTVAFDTRVDLTTNINVYEIAVGDLDQNGYPDIISSNRDAGSIRMYRNDATAAGEVGFTAITNYTVTDPTGVVMGDFNDDGFPDVAVSSSSAGEVRIFTNKSSGSGNFLLGDVIAFTTGGTNPVYLANGDLDGDGLDELIVANHGSSTVSICRNTSTGGVISFGSSFDLSAGTYPRGMELADLDGNGRLDLVGADYGSDQLTIRQNNFNDQLLAYYTFTGDITDETANGYDGVFGDGASTATFPSLTTDRLGVASQAYNFDGGDYISVAHNDDFLFGTDTDITVSCWVNTTSTTFGDIFFKEDGSYGYIVAMNASGTINVYAGASLDGSTAINDGVWHHVVAALDRDAGMRIYVDGVLDASNTELTNAYDFSDTRELLIGSGQDISNVKNTFFTGDIDEVRLYNYALTQTEIEGIYADEAPASSEPLGLVAFYKMDASAADASANAFDGSFGDGSTATTFPTATTDRFGTDSKALAYDGGDYMLVAHNDAFNIGTSKDFGVSGWFNTTSASDGVLFDKSNGSIGYIALLTSSGNVSYTLTDGTNSASLTSNLSGLNDGAWHHFVILIDRDGDLELYIDGTLSSNSATVTTAIDTDTTEDLLIGVGADTDNANLNSYFVGDLDDFRFFDELLTSEQITQFYHQGGWDITNAGLIGTALTGAANSDWIELEDLSFNPSFDGEFGKVVYLYDGDIQFRANSDDALVFGDDEIDGSVELNGTAISVAAGYYMIRWKPITKSYSITSVDRVGIIGSALTGTDAGWSGDDMVLADQGDGTYQLYNLKLGTGQWKIRVNNDWTVIDWGASATAGELSYYGENIDVAQGEYDLTFDIINNTYTLTESEYKTTPYQTQWVKNIYVSGLASFLDKTYLFSDYWDGGKPNYFVAEIGKYGTSERIGDLIPLVDWVSGDHINPVYGAEDGSGNKYMLGYLRGSVTVNGTTYTPSDTLDVDMVLFKFDADLNLVNIRHYDVSGTVDPTGLAVNDAGEVFMSFWYDTDFTFGGVNLSTASGNHVLAKLNASLNYSTHVYTNASQDMELTSDETSLYLATSGTRSVTRFSASDLSLQQEYTLPDANLDFHYSTLELLSDGDIIVAGRSELSTSGQTDIFIGRQDATTGDWEWYENVGGSANDGEDLYVELGSDDAIYVGTSFFGTWTWGSESLNSNGDKDFVLTKYSPTGQQLWLEHFGSATADNIYAMSVTQNDVYLGGYMSGAGATFADVTLSTEQNFFARFSQETPYQAGDLSAVNAYGKAGLDDNGFSVDAYDLQTTDQLTVEVLVRNDQFVDGTWKQFVQTDYWSFQYNSSGDIENLEVYLGDGTSTEGANAWIGVPFGDVSFDVNEWHHLAFTYDGELLTFYIDGQVTYNQIFSWTNPGTSMLRAMASADGAIDELRIWNDVRTVEELRATMQSELAGNETGLVGYWQFNNYTDLGDGNYAVEDVTANDKDLVFNPSEASITADLTVPQISSIHSVNFQGFTVDWDEVVAATSYGIEVSTNDLFTDVVLSETTTELSYKVGGLSAETEYFVHLYASNSEETTIYSNIQSVTTTAFELGSTADSLALIALYNSTNGSSWTNGWDLSQPMSTWYGVTLLNGRVTELELGENNLVGTLPAELSNLSELQVLTLFSNTISGEIPADIDALAQLTNLNLGGNQFTGALPTVLGNLSNLNYLYLWGNNFSGGIPVEFSGLTSLMELNMQSSNLSGQLPVELGSLSNLTLLALGGNNFSGNIPAELGNLTSLTLLYLWGNELGGTIPAELGNLTSMKSLSLSQNNFTGVVPSELSNLVNLGFLYLQDNYLTSIPDFTGTLFDGNGLYVFGNKLGFTNVQTNLPLSNAGKTYLYDPQYADDSVTLVPSVGTTVTLSTTETTAGTSYQWQKDGEDITGATSVSHSFSFAASDEGVYTVVMTNSNVSGLTITRLPYFISDGVNESPSDMELSNAEIKEGLAIGTFIGRLSTTDDPGDTHTYTLVAGTGGENNSSFSIDGNRLLTNEVFDYDMNTSLNVLIQTDDGLGGTYTEAFVISVIPVMECLNEVFTADSGTFSDGSMEFDYDDGFSCSWLIELGAGEQITLGFNSFSTEEGYDFVRIYDGSTTGATLLAELSGDITLPNEVTSTGNTMLVTFTSDQAVTAAGWEAYYSKVGENSAPVISNVNFPSSVTYGASESFTISADIADPDGDALSDVYVVYWYSTSVEDSYYSEAASVSGNTYEFSLNASELDRIGLTFYLYAYDGELETETGYYQISSAIGGSDIGILTTPTGSTSDDYRIVSLPFKTVRVGDVLGSNLSGEGNDVWRMLHYNGSTFQNLTANSSMLAGKGYWFLNTNVSQLTVPSAEIAEANYFSDFEIPLTSGYVQIGNPFPYPIDWAYVMDYNGLASADNQIKMYEHGWQNSNGLGVFDGGFFDNTGTGLSTLYVPVEAITTTFARVNGESSKSSNLGQLGTDDWSFGLNVTDDNLKYYVSAVGMNRESNCGLDQKDELVLPRLDRYLDIEFAGGLTKDIVNPADSYKWSFDINSTTGGEITISWDNFELQGNTYGMLLLDVDNQKLVDMSTQSNYTFNAQGLNSSFELYYGESNLLNSLVNMNANLMIDPYPNPFEQSITLPIATKSDNSDVTVSVLDIMGREVYKEDYRGLAQGFHELQFQAGDANIALQNGTYIIQVNIRSENTNTIFNKRVVYLR